VSGKKVENIYVKLGDTVKKGQLLFELEGADREAELEKLEYQTSRIILLCDVSGSMSGSVQSLKDAVVRFADEGKLDELAAYLSGAVDVLVGAGVSIAVLLVLRWLFRVIPEEKQARIFWGAAAAMGILLLLSCLLLDSSIELVAHGIKNLRRFTGMLVGLAAAYELDSRVVRFSTEASLPAQGLKLLLGALSAGGLYLLLDFAGLFGGWWALTGNALIVFYAAGVYPMTFKWWTKRRSV